jgi:hypothetical protein
VGPALGAASVLAAQGKSLSDVAATMVVFGVGAVEWHRASCPRRGGGGARRQP